MKQNRTLAYGYKIESGRIVTDHMEAEVVRRIYRNYAEGMSYKAIAESLTSEGIQYLPEKSVWNKNMVARILQNKNYLGTEKYPMIVEEALFQKIKLAQKPYTHTESEEIKAIKPLLVCGVCGKSIRRRVRNSGEERWYCEGEAKHISVTFSDKILIESVKSLWHRLAANVELADIGEKTGESNPISLEMIRLKNEIEQMLKAGVINESEALTKIRQLAALRYYSCDTFLHHNRILMQKLQQAPQEFQVKMILEITTEIKISFHGVESIVLKNGKVIEKGADHHGQGES